MRRDPDEVVAALIPALDNLRKNWLSQVLERCSRTHPIVHKAFTRETDLGIAEDDLPSTFPFNRFDGEAAAALILNWQLQVAIKFSGQHGYFAEDELGAFVGSLMKHGSDNSLRLRTFGSFFSSEPLKPEHASIHLAQYLLGSTEQTEQVQALGEELLGFLYILTLATQAAVAQSFGDDEEAARCTAAIGGLTKPPSHQAEPPSRRPKPPSPTSASELRSRATTALVVSLLALFVCPFLGPVAVFLGVRNREAMKAANLPAGKATAAIAIGVFITLVFLFYIVAYSLGAIR